MGLRRSGLDVDCIVTVYWRLVVSTVGMAWTVPNEILGRIMRIYVLMTSTLC